MRYRKLPKTDIEVSEVSLGCWQMGGESWNMGLPSGWSDVDEQEVVTAVRYAVDNGINHFDNADVYGNGSAERRLAKALEGTKANVTIGTKVGFFQGTGPHAYTPLNIRHQCEQSLENLRRDHIDIYYFHHTEFGPNDQYLEGALDTMQRLQKEGKIRHIGLSGSSPADFVRLLPRIKPAVLQAKCNIMNDTCIRPGNPVPQALEQLGIGEITYSPLNQGLLLDKYDPKNPPKFAPGDNRAGKEEFKPENLAKLHERLQKVKERFGQSANDLERVALQFLLGHKSVACVIPGFRNINHVKGAIAAAEKPLSPEEVDWIRELFHAEELAAARK